MTLEIDAHPLLSIAAFRLHLPAPLGKLDSPAWLVSLLHVDAPHPFEDDAEVGTAIRNLLRHGGYKPTGRGKPASEYLSNASRAGSLGSINAAVDLCNVVSLHSGLPISLTDANRLTPPLRIGIAGRGDNYVFNAGGQTIDLSGLLCLFDGSGACANGVKDSQRTKTSTTTTDTLTVVWCHRSLEPRLRIARDWYWDLAARLHWVAVDIDRA